MGKSVLFGGESGEICPQIHLFGTARGLAGGAVFGGCGASEENGEETSECQISYGSGVISYPQSTTGNITGIFDMVGGAVEHVMGVYSDSDGNPMAGISGFNGLRGDDTTMYLDGISFPHSKYYNLYLRSQFNAVYSELRLALCTVETCGGHALNETAGWYGDKAGFVYYEYMWLGRGGSYKDGSGAGVFYSGLYGYSHVILSWRSVFIPNAT